MTRLMFHRAIGWFGAWIELAQSVVFVATLGLYRPPWGVNYWHAMALLECRANEWEKENGR